MKIYGVYLQESWSGGGFDSYWTTKSKATAAALELVKKEQKLVTRKLRFADRMIGNSEYIHFTESTKRKDMWIGGQNNDTTISIEEIEVNE